eukprot:m.691003 g.691003  ORF g.691003 m.691003 type:complete len:71 (-) comp22852_c0_seq41:1226-1438(-)
MHVATDNRLAADSKKREIPTEQPAMKNGPEFSPQMAHDAGGSSSDVKAPVTVTSVEFFAVAAVSANPTTI